MESNHLKVKSSNSDLSKNSSTNNNHENNENIDQGRKTLTSLDPSTFSEGSVQTQLMDKIIDDEQIQQLGYDLEVNIPKTVLDEIFYSYFLKQRSFGLIWFLISSIHFDAYCVWLQYTNSWISFGFSIILMSLNLSMIIILLYTRYIKSRHLQTIWKISPYFAWLISVFQIGSFYFVDPEIVNPLEVLSWGIFINFQIYITLPIPLLWQGVILGILNGMVFTAFNILMCQPIDKSFRYKIIVVNIIMGVTAAIIGIVHSILNELKQRIAFLEAKKSLEVNMKIEEHSQVQERLLLSVLPKYVADKVRMDMGVTKSDQFKKIYMSRHENVSILYADIVGFTAISSTYSAQDLVKMLNELFARFDRLADKYEQLRIKILGDCYYCISGAPDEKLDHAILSCHMGLSMVHAIKYLQHKTNSPVDMRVGIHTGAILAGILGQRQWQFDVYSRDVELANKMESSGMAGRVHISEKTRLCLRDQFVVEPAYGEKREPALRLAGLTTYFITKVLVPFEERNRSLTEDHLAIDMQSEKEEGFKDMIDVDSVSSMEIQPQAEANSKLEEFVDRFKKELNELTQDELHFRQLSEKTNMFLTFVNTEVEKAFNKNREKISSLTLLPIALISIVDTMCSTYSFKSKRGILFQYGPSMVVLAVTIIFMAESCGVLSNCLRRISKRVNDNQWLRHGIAFTVILITIINFLNEMISFFDDIHTIDLKYYEIEILSFQSFYTNLGILLLMSVAVISHLTHIAKIGIMVGYLFLYSISLFITVHRNDESNMIDDSGVRNNPFNLNMIILLSAVTLVLCYLSRYMDRDDRIIFMWKTEVAEQRKTYADMRKKNQTLVYNVLPVNVAEHFMKNIKRSHLYLYSQSYSEVGVLFASMPNFSDFYSEETVNNQGLECLRVLNEVISDYDALLDLPRFKEITKIKTIGSTYMAASGLNILNEFDQSEPIVVRWSHLDILVQFAFELTQALQDINEQSFNNFVLKMGINHGPITAGVIGASKPHYDIWGNTVNVASRMESTGQAGAIQVTKETAQILSFFGYTFRQRGYVNVKGKGELLTFYLQGKESLPDHTTITPTTSSPINTSPNNTKMLQNKSIKNSSLLDITSNGDQNASVLSNTKNLSNKINDIGSSQINLISLNNDQSSSILLNKDEIDGPLKSNGVESSDSKASQKAIILKDEESKNIEEEVDVRTPLLNSKTISCRSSEA